MKKLTPVLLLALVLTACQKPTPSVTAATVGSSVRAQAVCWSAESTTPIGSDCSLNPSLVRNLSVTPGEFVGFSVDKEIAESGWVVVVNGSRVTNSLLKTRYYRFNTAENSFSNGPLEVEVYAITPDSKARGVWAFTLAPRS